MAGGAGEALEAGQGLLLQPLPGHCPQLCVVLNNVELVRRASGQALRGLAWPEGALGLEGVLPRPLLSCMQALEEDLHREAHTVTAHLTSKVGSVAWRAGVEAVLRPHPRAEHRLPSDGGRHSQVCAAHQPLP